MLNTPQALTACSFYSVMYQCRHAAIQLRPLAVKQLDRRALQVQTPAGKPQPAMLKAFIDFMLAELRAGERYCQQHWGLEGER